MKWFVGTFALISIFSSSGFAQSCPGSVPANMSCVAHGASTTVTAFSVTRSVTNNSPNGMAIMIPLGTSTEEQKVPASFLRLRGVKWSKGI